MSFARLGFLPLIFSDRDGKKLRIKGSARIKYYGDEAYPAR
jgi:hypothetical protein